MYFFLFIEQIIKYLSISLIHIIGQSRVSQIMAIQYIHFLLQQFNSISHILSHPNKKKYGNFSLVQRFKRKANQSSLFSINNQSQEVAAQPEEMAAILQLFKSELLSYLVLLKFNSWLCKEYTHTINSINVKYNMKLLLL